jgi:xanthine dehydrogenase YagS FAD-binding subunit
MKSFTYYRVNEVAVALQMAGPETRFIGGGTNLLDLWKMGVEQPERVVDINRLPLARIEPSQGGLRIGALARNSDVAEHPAVLELYPVLSQALLAGASPQLRNAATVGGNLMQRTRCYYFYDAAFQECNKRRPGSGCGALRGFNRIHAILGQSEHCIAVHPSDMCVALAALDAVVHVQGPAGTRRLPFDDFHRLPGDHPEIDTNLRPDELILAIELPDRTARWHSSYVKVRDRTTYAFALVSAAVALQVSAGAIVQARVALGGVAHKPWRALKTEAILAGQAPDDALFTRAAEAELAQAQGYAYNAFKIELAKRTIVEALRQATGTV